MNFKGRTRKLASNIARSAKVDLVAVTTLPNLRYLFDYAGKSYERFCCGLISLAEARTALVIPKLDQAKAERSAAGNVFSWTDSEGYKGAFKQALAELGVAGKSRVACEDGITLGQMESIKKVLKDSKFSSVTDQISELRLTKDSEELEALVRSARILARGYRSAEELLRVGARESEVSFEFKRILQSEGAEEVDFCAVQSGANAAIPHQEISSKRIANGDMIVVDVSCTEKDGYFADFTRTYAVGPPSVRQKQVYEIVKQAQEAGVEAGREGSSAEDVDRASRSVIEKAGFGEFFVHRTGHGLGLEGHEPPWIKDGNEMKLRRGMAFTVEPGIYLPGKFGVRIEDNLVLTETGTKNITTLSHELVEL